MYHSDPTPPVHTKTLHLQRIKRGQVVVCTVLSHMLTGVWTHWTGTRTTPCYFHEPTCPGCATQSPRRWKGYLHCWNPSTNSNGIIELTPAAATELLNALPPKSSLRGLQIRLERTKGANNGRLSCSVIGRHPDPDSIPKECAAWPTLSHIWGDDKQPPLGLVS